MNKQLLLITIFLLSVSFATAQDATPTPTPEVKEVKEVKKVEDVQEVQPEKVEDVQEVQPEKLKGVPSIAPQYQSEDKSLPDLGRVGVDMLDQKTLTLREAIKLALENNKDIEVSRQTVKSAEFDLQSADGFYVPRISGQTFFERAVTPNINIFNPTQTAVTNNTTFGNITYQSFIRKYGSTYSATLSNQRVTTDNAFSVLNSQYVPSLNLTFVQPLRRGKNIDNQRRVIEIAKKNLSLTDTQFRQKSIEIITTVQRAYWDLTFALRNLQVQRDGVRDAKEQLEHNQRLVKEGQLAPIDAVAAETQVANLELSVYDALETVNRAENILKNLIAVDKSDTLWGMAVLPTDKVDLEIPNTTLPESLQLAMQNRPEIEINETAEEINKIDFAYLKEQTKSQVDFTASYTSTGITGTLNPNLSSPFGPITLPSGISGGNISAIGNIITQRYPTLRFGVTFNLPLKNKTAEAQIGKNLVEADKLKIQREQLEQSIQVDVRNALQSLRTSEARLRTAALARENSQKQYESEQRKLDAGQSDVYKVLERQTALMNARSNELRSQTELNKAIADLQRATGNSLKANNVEARLRK
jgi:outer membrane protein